jgi:glycosyltransferase involved in cell wall biosynthesis
VISVLELRSVRGTGGGPEKTILHGALQHDRDRFKITVCYIRDLRDHVFTIDQRAEQLGVQYVEVTERHSFDRGVWPQLVSLARDRRFDIVHGHDYKTNLLALLLARRTGSIPLATSHGWTGNSARERFVYYPADRRVLRRFPRVVAVSGGVRNELVRAGVDAARVTVLPNGIDPQTYRRGRAARERVRRQLDVEPEAFAIGAVGRIERQKRFDLLLDAFATLRQSHPELRLVIAGDGSLRGAVAKHAAALGVADACRFLGHRSDIVNLHQAFDLFVQSSEYEGTPNAVLEAMAMETPLVATDVGGTSELALPDVHGLIVSPLDTRALVAAIEQVLGDPEGARLRALAARQRIERELSFAERTRRLEEIYVSLAGSGLRTVGSDTAEQTSGATHA